MKSPSQSNGQLVWQELLSPNEIEEWAVSRKQPRKLWRVDGVSRPGVYRFVFPKDRSCYIGVAGHFGRRLHDHICPRASQQSKGDTKKVYGWSVRGGIEDSLGECYLQHLTIEGAVRICGVVISQHDIDDFFARLLLENWAILHSERIDKLRPRNRDIPTGIQQGTKDFLRLAKGNVVKAVRNGMDVERGWPESL
jgi:hypothetical protein